MKTNRKKDVKFLFTRRLIGIWILCLAFQADSLAAEEQWFVFQPNNQPGSSVIGMEDWLDKPAGRHGVLLIKGDRMVFEDGTPVKFWGVNIGGGGCCPNEKEAVAMAECFAKYGVNSVRLHKPWADLYAEDDSTSLRPDALKRFDFFCNELRKRGIYYAWSFFYQHKLRGKDIEKLKYPKDFEKTGQYNQYGIADYCPDVQQILIEASVNLLNHRNPGTGLRYADDPALVSLEFQNESCIMFWSGRWLLEMPNYLADFTGRFNAYLKKKYGSHEKLVAAWGSKALDVLNIKGENLDKGNFEVVVDAVKLSDQGLTQAEEKGYKQRILDNAAFLHEEQNAFYGRFTEAVRKTGYKGPLVGSCWRAQGGITEYYNLRSDWLVGIIDRHNYHGGLSGWKPRTGDTFGTKAQVNIPGSGLFSSGMTQVIDRPFAFSEWCTVFPNEWSLESPAIIAVYGMGLQGWDASYQFAIQKAGFLTTIHENNLWTIARPENMGLYPAIARMIYRNDVLQGDVVSIRALSMDDLYKGILPWGNEWYSGWKDIKVYQGPIPGQALAAGRVAVEFVDKPTPSKMPDMSLYSKDGVITSTTRQLVWDISNPEKGFFTVNTPGTRAVVGFNPGKKIQLDGVTIELQDTPFAGVFVSSLLPEKSIKQTDRVLITAMARAKNTGMEFNEKRDALVSLGNAPILLEPVKGTIGFEGRTIQAVNILDHDGRRTDKTLPSQGGSFHFDGAKDKTLYYEIQFSK
jgi:hypothetical protein